MLPSARCAVVAASGFDPWPEEAVAVANAVAARRADFAAGRAAARRALAKLGHAAVAIPVGERRAPVFPPGISGSIAHGGGVAIAAVSRDLAALGVDIEPARPLPPEVRDLVITTNDRLGDAPDVVAFSAKESVYKALQPTRGWLLEFADVTLDVRADGTMTANAKTANANGLACEGRWAIVEGFALTACIVTR
jgi:4'-phosphopantetheinyl transferase EntD